MRRSAAAFALVLLYVLPTAHAHQPSESYLWIRPASETTALTLRWDIALADLEHAIGLDNDGDGNITWGEVKNRREALAAYALANLALTVEGESCATAASQLRIAEHGDGLYAVLDVVADCAKQGPALEIRYDLLFDLDPTHRGLLVYDEASGSVAGVFSPEQRTFDTVERTPGRAETFVRFISQGIHHIAIGYDHIAFLALLLLPAGLTRRQAAAGGATDARTIAVDILKVITAFTLAHSLTLGLAATGTLTFPPYFIEAAIAASIIVAALVNLVPRLHSRRWWIAFGFGLVHGFGFANVLGELDLGGMALAAPLAGFNVGVELGQLAIAAVALPLLLLVRRQAFYRRAIVPGGSVGVALLAAYWLIERL